MPPGNKLLRIVTAVGCFQSLMGCLFTSFVFLFKGFQQEHQSEHQELFYLKLFCISTVVVQLRTQCVLKCSFISFPMSQMKYILIYQCQVNVDSQCLACGVGVKISSILSLPTLLRLQAAQPGCQFFIQQNSLVVCIQ